jgi:quercetin dioxygenase-like cupin family protein
MKKLVVTVGLIILAGSALAQDAMKVFKPDALTWKPNPVFPKGAQTVILEGNPTKPGLFVIHTKFPANYQVPPHTHPVSEVVTVLSGSFWNGMGDKFDPQKGEMMKAGSAFVLPAKHPHYVWTTNEEVIVQVSAVGPFGIDYLNPADDPRKK